MRPELGFSTPVSVLISVDLPAPLSPISPTISFRPIVRLMFFNAWIAPKYFCTFSSRTMSLWLPLCSIPSIAPSCLLLRAPARSASFDRAVGLRQELAYRQPCGNRLAVADGPEDRLVLHERCTLVLARCHREDEEIGEKGFDHPSERAQEVVARRIEDGEVETHIRRVPQIGIRGCRHFPIGLFDPAEFQGSAGRRGESRRFRLDYPADLLHIRREPVEIRRCAVPAEHIGIKQIPL